MFFGKYPLGTIVVFRYTSPTAHDATPNVMVLAQNYKNKMHGLNLRYMTPKEQMVVQWFFKGWLAKQFSQNPFTQIENEFNKQMEDYNKKREEQLKKQTGVVVKPPTAMPGKPTATFPTSTWSPTPKQAIPAASVYPQEEPIVQPDPSFVNRIKDFLQQRARFAAQTFGAEVPTNPFEFYHRTLKPLFGRDNKRFYRQYDVNHIHNVRIMKGAWS